MPEIIDKNVFENYKIERESRITEKNNIIENAIKNNSILTSTQVNELRTIESDTSVLDINYMNTLLKSFGKKKLTKELTNALESLCTEGRTPIMNNIILSIEGKNPDIKNVLIETVGLVTDIVKENKLDAYIPEDSFALIREGVKQKNFKKVQNALENEVKNKKNKKIKILAGVGTVGILILVITLVCELMKKDLKSSSSGNKQNITTTYSPSPSPNPNYVTQDELDTFKLLALWCYMNQTAGCFMVRDSSFIIMNGCSDWYGNDTSNMLNCSCGDITTSLSTSTCDSEAECLKPYCIGNSKCSQYNTSDICTSESHQTLYKCTNTKLGDPNYVYYTYIDNSVLSIIGNAVDLSNSITTNSNSINIMKYVPYVIGISLFIFFIIIIVKIFSKNVLGRK